MRITVLAHGTRGDVYPLTALAAELARRGHQVRVGASVNLVDTGRRLGLEIVPIAWDTQRVLESARGRAWVSSADAGSFLRLLREIGREHDDRLDEEVIGVCAGSDAIVSGALLEWRAAMLAKAHRIPLIAADCYPRRMNDVVPHPLVTIDPDSDAAATYRTFARLSLAQVREQAGHFRRRLALTAPSGGQVRPPSGGQVRPPSGGQVGPPPGGQVRPPSGGQVGPPPGGQVRPLGEPAGPGAPRRPLPGRWVTARGAQDGPAQDRPPEGRPAQAWPPQGRPAQAWPAPEWPPARPLELQAYSPVLVPGLAWDAYRPFVGDLRMSRPDLSRLGTSAMDAGVAEWLDAGERPAFFTFGSTYIADPAQLLAVIGRVCQSLGLRGLVVAGWGLPAGARPAGARPTGTRPAGGERATAGGWTAASGWTMTGDRPGAGGRRTEPGPDLRVVPYADYDVVLPRCTVAVHHGGATVTAAGVRAGIPAMVSSAAFDQPFWGAQLERLGAGVHVRHPRLTEDVLRAGILRLMTEPVRRRAALLGERLRAERDGTQAAADEIGKYLAAHPGQAGGTPRR